MFGPEGPITDRNLAEQRAAVCAVCPLNQAGDWTALFTVPVSNTIRAVLGAIKGQGLTTTRDEALHVCSACACPMKLKVWCRLPHILNHMPAESKAALDPRCWITREAAEQPK